MGQRFYFLIIITAIIFIVFEATSYTAFAQEEVQNPPATTLPNPLGETNTVWELIDKIIAALRDFIAPPIVGLMVMYGAFQILTASDSEDKFKSGKKTILYAVIGYAIILIASGISLIIKDVLR